MTDWNQWNERTNVVNAMRYWMHMWNTMLNPMIRMSQMSWDMMPWLPGASNEFIHGGGPPRPLGPCAESWRPRSAPAQTDWDDDDFWADDEGYAPPPFEAPESSERGGQWKVLASPGVRASLRLNPGVAAGRGLEPKLVMVETGDVGLEHTAFFALVDGQMMLSLNVERTDANESGQIFHGLVLDQKTSRQLGTLEIFVD